MLAGHFTPPSVRVRHWVSHTVSPVSGSGLATSVQQGHSQAWSSARRNTLLGLAAEAAPAEGKGKGCVFCEVVNFMTLY